MASVGDANGTSHDCNGYLATVLIMCVDTTGVVAAIAQLLQGHGLNILRCEQHTDKDSPNTNYYFQRLVVDYKDILVGTENATAVLDGAFKSLSKKYTDMTYRISLCSKKKRVALMVSKESHCMYDLLMRTRSGELDCDIVLITSNHDKLKPVADMFGIPFRHLPISPGGKRAQELEVEACLGEFNIDLIVLARYMQILSNEFCKKYSSMTINIHHSPLPAFEGARPYHRAHKRGVKVIGATAHYATSDLDQGPIIEQDICRISHRDHIHDLIRKGRDLERVVLARAVRWHCLDAILVHNNKTIVFDT